MSFVQLFWQRLRNFFILFLRETEGLIVHPADVILFEGILVLYNKEIRKLLDMKIFVDTDSDTRLARRGKESFLIMLQYPYQ